MVNPPEAEAEAEEEEVDVIVENADKILRWAEEETIRTTEEEEKYIEAVYEWFRNWNDFFYTVYM